jgi:flagellar FliL protein
MADEVADGAKEGEAPPEEKKKKKGKAWLWILIAVLLLGAGGGTTAVLMWGGSDDAADGEASQAEAPRQEAGLLTMDTFLVNLNDRSGDHYLKLTLRLTVLPSALAEDIKGDDLLRARLRDRILTILTAKTLEEIGTPLGKESLRHEIQANVRPLLGDGEVEDVLFSEFVVQ